ncbi:MAG: hypothetical protein SOV90_06490 [Lachnospiraceae bacterium]|nr:hypothetical protein [Lachnospiraceae bacterium]
MAEAATALDISLEDIFRQISIN